MNRFTGLEGPPLHDAVLEVRRRHARSEFELLQALMAVESTGLHLQMRCGTVVDYASRHLNLDPHKAAELVRVGRLLPQYPHLAAAVEEGGLHWSKIREITRVIAPDNEERLIEYARAHKSHEVERMVARRPRRAAEVVPAATVAVGAAPEAAPRQQDLFEETSSAAPPEPSDEPPVKPVEILYEMRLSPMQWAKQEQALNRTRARLGYHASRAKVQEELCDLALSVGDVRTRIRYQVYLHVDGLTGQGWLDTDRGFLPAPPDVVKAALSTGRVKRVSRVPDPVGNSRAWGRVIHTHIASDAGPGDMARGAEAPTAPVADAIPAEAAPARAADAVPASARTADAIPAEAAPARTDDAVPASARTADAIPVEADPARTADAVSAEAASARTADAVPAEAASARTADAVPSEAPSGRTADAIPAEAAPAPADDDTSGPPPPRPPHSKGRRKVPVEVLRQLMEDSEGRCVDCGRRMRVQHNHRDEPYSDRPEHDPERMDSRCDSCHRVFHLDDFRLRPGWREARDRAIARRLERRGRTVASHEDST